MPRRAAETREGIQWWGGARSAPSRSTRLGGPGLSLWFLFARRLLLRDRRRNRRRRVRGGASRRLTAPEADDRRRDEHARVGAGDDADHHRESEPVQHV